jgi:DNA-binding MarR family transcriptional regulator
MLAAATLITPDMCFSFLLIVRDYIVCDIYTRRAKLSQSLAIKSFAYIFKIIASGVWSVGMSMKNKAKAEPSTAPGGLADFLCFAIYSTNLAFGRVYKPLVERLGLTYPQFITLVALHEKDNQTVGELGAKLFLDSSTLTPLLKRLEAMGYVSRERDPADERQVRVRLTADGRAIREKGVCGLDPIADATGLAPQEFARIQKELCALRDNLLKASKA